MGSVPVVELTIPDKDALQATQTEKHEMIKALTIHAAHPAFRMSIGVRCAIRRLHHLKGRPLHCCVEVMGEQVISVMEHKPRADALFLAHHQQIASHLAHRLAVGTERGFGKQNPARAQMQHEQHVGGSQPRPGSYFLGEEISAEQRFGMAGEELPPAQPVTLGRWRQPVAAQDVRDATLGPHNAQLDQFPPDALVAPAVLPCQTADQGFDVTEGPGPARLSTASGAAVPLLPL